MKFGARRYAPCALRGQRPRRTPLLAHGAAAHVACFRRQGVHPRHRADAARVSRQGELLQLCWLAAPRSCATRVLLAAARRSRARAVARAARPLVPRRKRVGRRSCSMGQSEADAAGRARAVSVLQAAEEVPEAAARHLRRCALAARPAEAAAGHQTRAICLWLGETRFGVSTASAPRARLPTPDARLAAALTADGAADGAPGSAGAQPEHIRELTQQERAFVRALNTVRARSGGRAARALRHAADCAAPCGARA
jgi:hypothetical protein